MERLPEAPVVERLVAAMREDISEAEPECLVATDATLAQFLKNGGGLHGVDLQSTVRRARVVLLGGAGDSSCVVGAGGAG